MQLRGGLIAISALLFFTSGCAENSEEPAVNSYRLEVNQQMSKGCGLEKTLDLLARDPMALDKLRSNNDPDIRVGDIHSAMTADYRQERQTIVIDDSKMVIMLRCG